LATVQSIATVAALIVGGFWAYFKVFKGRTYTKRLEPSVSAKLVVKEDYTCAVVRVSIRNVGLTRVDIDLLDSAIKVYSYTRENYEPEFHNAIWTDLGTIDALVHHAWIEPGENLIEDRLLALPNEKPIAIMLKLRLLPKLPSFSLRRQRTEWNAVAVSVLEEATVETTGGVHPAIE
jgi:hypothetical protein